MKIIIGSNQNTINIHGMKSIKQTKFHLLIGKRRECAVNRLGIIKRDTAKDEEQSKNKLKAFHKIKLSIYYENNSCCNSLIFDPTTLN